MIYDPFTLAVLETLKAIGIVYLSIGTFFFILSIYLDHKQHKSVSVVSTFINMTFIVLWLPYFIIYQRTDR